MTRPMMQEYEKIDALRQTVAAWRKQGDTVALVPTMGALHAGHISLVAAAKRQAARVVVSIFVNPTQFGPKEDLSRYPRPIERDRALLRDAGADALWLPTVGTMYPKGFATSIHVAGVSEGLCGAVRPGHFDGVATVVAKLLLQVAPDVALFGEKDYQQLCVIHQMVTDLNLPVKIVGAPIMREADGLAMSSRNSYLSVDERAAAPQLYATLQAAGAQLKSGQPLGAVVEAATTRLLAAGFDSVDYLELREEGTLAPLAAYQPPARLLIAARLGTTRLIDTIGIA